MTNNRAFTLIELLVVVLIIGILAAVALPKYEQAVLKSRFTQAKIVAQNLSSAQETFYIANGTFTPDIDNLDISLPNVQRVQTNGEEKIYHFSWGFCSMDANEGVNTVKCTITQNGNDIISLQQNSSLSNADPNIKKCLTSATDYSKTANQICKQETNATPYKNKGLWVYNY